MNTSVYRVDKFAVPPDALPAFLERVRHIDRLLAMQPGCKQHLVLTQTEGPGEFNVVTIVEWADAAAMAQAGAVAQERYARESFNPQRFMKSWGVRGDLSVYSAA